MRPDKRVRVYLRALFLVTTFFSSPRFATAATETLLTTQTPQLFNVSDGSSANYELGAKFTSAIAGHITAIRFWKASRETGTHVGHVWSASGQLLASQTKRLRDGSSNRGDAPSGECEHGLRRNGKYREYLLCCDRHRFCHQGPKP